MLNEVTVSVERRAMRANVRLWRISRILGPWGFFGTFVAVEKFFNFEME